MSKYKPLWEHLRADGRESIQLSFDEIRDILGFDIDHSFLNYKKEAVNFNYQIAKVNIKKRSVLFYKLV
ncbi:MAG: hypothetical protein FWC54_03525 [Actinomycetia bacterium]|nr:hypothetical protein [Actinomycetes bacterium]